MPSSCTSRYSSVVGCVETTISGRVAATDIDAMVAGYRQYDRSVGRWLIRADGATSYAPDAIQRAVAAFGDLHKSLGLTKIIAVLTVPTVRMGASVVSMGLRASGSSLEIIICANIDEATRTIEQLRKT